jgi:biopolymer transport protein TolQ
MLMHDAVNFFADLPFSVSPAHAGQEGIVYAFQHSNLAGKAVIFILVIGSIFSWSVTFTKVYMIHCAKKETRRFLKRFRTARKPLAIYQNREPYPDSPTYAVYMAGCRELTFHLLGTTEIDDTFSTRLAEADRISPVAMNAVRSALEREVGEQALRMEDRMTVLATAVSGAPFLGLLGTVWGVMDTFSAIASSGNASLTTMAPGVSGALITTVTGLLVAIPAMFGYNFLVVTIRGMTVELDNFAGELAASFDHRYLDTGTRVSR